MSGRAEFVRGVRSALHLKDARIVLETAAEVGSPVPSFGELDPAALVTLLEDEAAAGLRKPTA